MDNENTVVVNSENFSAFTAAGDKLVLVDFWAKWCGPCRAVAPLLSKLADEYQEKIVIGKVNIDENKELTLKNNVASIPTIQLYKGGEIVASIIGAQPYEVFKEAVEKFAS